MDLEPPVSVGSRCPTVNVFTSTISNCAKASPCRSGWRCSIRGSSSYRSGRAEYRITGGSWVVFSATAWAEEADQSQCPHPKASVWRRWRSPPANYPAWVAGPSPIPPTLRAAPSRWRFRLHGWVIQRSC